MIASEEFNYRLYNGDSLEILKQIPNESVDLVATDCPYHIVSGGCTTGAYGNKVGCGKCSVKWETEGQLKNFNNIKAGKIFEHNDIEFEEWLPEIYRVLKEETHCYIMINGRNLAELQMKAEKVGFVFQQLLVWDKGNCLGGNTQIFIRNKKNGIAYRSNLKDLYRNTTQETITDYEIMGDNGKFKNCVNIWNNGIQEGVYVSLRNGQKIFATLEHKFETSRGLLKVKDLKIGDVVKTTYWQPISSNNESYLNYDMGYFIGLYLAEGNKNHSQLKFTLSEDEYDTLGKTLRNYCDKYNGKYSVFRHKDKKCDTHSITSNILMGIIDEFITGRTAKTKHLKRETFNTNRQFLSGIFHGYVDGDGHLEKQGSGYRWTIGFTYNKELENDLRVLCSFLGYKMVSKLCKIKAFNKEYTCIRGHISQDTTHYNSKKQGEIISISTIQKHMVYDLEVEGNHLYSLVGGIISHNSTPNKWYLQACEFILMLRKGKAKNINNLGTKTLLSVPNIHGTKFHPTEKPVSLMEILIDNSTKDNETVLDPFMGSGTTGVASINLGRKFIGIELDKEYFDIAAKRIENETKQMTLF